MALAITGGRIIDPSRRIDRPGDLVIEGDTIAGERLAAKGAENIDATGLWVVPGLIDAHVHLREPGDERKETIATGLAAAAAGGFTAVMAMPNTRPANDSTEVTRFMIDKAAFLGGTRLYPVAAITLGRHGRELAPFAKLAAAGAVAFSDDGSGVADAAIIEQALTLARDLGLVVIEHAEDPSLSRGGVIHEGEVSRRLGVPGWPVEAEERMVERDLAIAERLGARLHVAHVSSAGTVRLVREARARGVRVSTEVAPHHLMLTDEDVLAHGPMAKVNPPLRSAEHVAACREGLADGAIDMVATDHAPHTVTDKEGGLLKAAFGLVGLETAVGLLLQLVEEGVLTPPRLVEVMSCAPARAFGLPGGTLAPGSIADVTLIDPAARHVVDPSTFCSKGRNTPFAGRRLPGRAVRTIVAGRTVFVA
ncbi:MAG: dihydroorotase [Deltaproteobacteria bacterium]|nr:dihydroorotase [Deltaproteobacteria bacterium]